MRFLFRTLAIFDVFAIVIIGMQLYNITKNFDEKILLSEKIQAILMYPMFVLIIAGAIGLFFLKRYGFILYYIQFPFRLYLFIFTLGFITLIPEALENYEDKWPEILKKVCFVAEVVRLYLTIRGHQQLRQD
ncbi:MAG: hypothetical protein REI78_15740 [Pedobacter sp.]|nr:hypothetical protein [Pedobacter sp.]MDQ8054482.1 hypothetical protein [Pedobacter sp.]